MNTKITALLIAIIMPLNIFAAVGSNTDSMAKAKELIQLLEIKKSIDSSMSEITKFSSRMIDSQNLTADEKVNAKNIMQASMKATFAEMQNVDWDTMFAEVYASVFTADEIDGLIKFYKSPIGQKLLAKEPQLTKATMARMQKEMAKIMPKVQDNMLKAIQQAKNSGQN